MRPRPDQGSYSHNDSPHFLLVKLSLHLSLTLALAAFGSTVAQETQTPAAAPAPQGQSPAAAASTAMDETRSLLQQWAATQRLISSERTEWETGKAMLEGRIQLLKSSIEETEKKIAEAKTKLEDAKKRTAEAEAEKAQIKEASDALIAAAPELEKGVKDLFKRVPGIVQEKVKVLHDRIPKEGADLKNITAAERFQNVLGILNELNKANNELNSLPEIHDLGNGKKAEVKVVYVGLGQGYFVNSNGDIGGLGLPSETGWVWNTDAAIAPKMRELVEVMKKAVAPKLVELPAQIQ
jgi:predicted  nucleic acid-binding Zn-ribbon protein